MRFLVQNRFNFIDTIGISCASILIHEGRILFGIMFVMLMTSIGVILELSIKD